MEELAAIRQTLQTNLETSIRRIADLQAALEEVASSDSDTERCLRGAGGAGLTGGCDSDTERCLGTAGAVPWGLCGLQWAGLPSPVWGPGDSGALWVGG